MKKNVRKNILLRGMISLRQEGFRATIFKLHLLLADFFFDFKFGVDTCGIFQLDDLTVSGDNRERGNEYKPTGVMLLRKMFDLIKPMIPDDGVLVDFGCGKGRVLLVASEFGFREGRGVEFAKELCTIARSNCAAYKNRTNSSTEFRIIESDAMHYPVQSDDNVFFMFNPFDEAVLNRVLDNIALSLEVRPRKMLIIYCNPVFSRQIEERDVFVKLREFDFWGNHFAVYSNAVESGTTSAVPVGAA